MHDNGVKQWVLRQAKIMVKTREFFRLFGECPPGLKIRSCMNKKYLLGKNMVVRFNMNSHSVYLSVVPRYTIILNDDVDDVVIGFPTLASARWVMKHNNLDDAELSDDFTGKKLG
jgi:hypothetical protein